MGVILSKKFFIFLCFICGIYIGCLVIMFRPFHRFSPESTNSSYTWIITLINTDEKQLEHPVIPSTDCVVLYVNRPKGEYTIKRNGFERRGNVTELQSSENESRNLGDWRILCYLYAIANGALQIYEIGPGVNLNSIQLQNPTHRTEKSWREYGLVYFKSAYFKPHIHFYTDQSCSYRLRQVHPLIKHGMVVYSDPGIAKPVNLTNRAPPVFLSPGVFSYFSIKNTLYTHEALWALFTPQTSPMHLSDVCRNLINQRLLWEIGGTVGFYSPSAIIESRSPVLASAQQASIARKEKRLLLNFLLKWRCASSCSFFECMIQITKDLARNKTFGFFDSQNTALVEAWLEDLSSHGYREPPRVEWKVIVDGSKTELSLNESRVIYTRPKRTLTLPEHVTAMSTICPNMTKSVKPSQKSENILLLVIFNFPHYGNIPSLHKTYSYSFSKIVYCGSHIDQFRNKSAEFGFNVTFIELGHKYMLNGAYFYRCMEKVMRMNYDVEGYLLIGDDVLINPWRIQSYPKNKMWLPKGNYARLSMKKPGWVHWDAFYGREAMKRLLNVLETNYSERYERFKHNFIRNTGCDDGVPYGGSDIVYIPKILKDDALFYLELFSNHSIFLEIAVHSIVFGMQPEENVFKLPGAYLWTGAQKSRTYSFFKPSIFFLHPFKFGPELKKRTGKEFFCTQYVPYLFSERNLTK
ncbi:uncharacterized protein LOC126831048 isoform X2 [Patella vulgata]|uniref:uncharacterized protein LOC126831048 isoform X2 n=1 Tax=Patella vulgata TaxID=6465 RepID=UPI0024A7B915|nr:uncharacterized protein LOC126831048 isoform X2 [Patella vulgata]